MKNILTPFLLSIIIFVAFIYGHTFATVSLLPQIIPAEINWPAHQSKKIPEFLVGTIIPTTFVGLASWYDYTIDGVVISKSNPTAASTRYPRGSQLRVTLLDEDSYNSQLLPLSVDVFINDYGPEAQTCREIDLSSFAFQQLSPLLKGLINVKVELLSLPNTYEEIP